MDPHERANRLFWDADADAYQDVHGDDLASRPLAWGAFRAPEAELGLLGETAGRDVLELGCGAAQWSHALAAVGARVVGLDLSAAQLRHARRRDPRRRAPLVLASATSLPLADRRFDVVFCDHGAASFCDPDALLAEVARVLRPGGTFAFCHATPLLYLTYDDGRERQTRTLARDWSELGWFDEGEGTVDVVLGTGEWIRLFRRHGFVVEDLVELVAPPDATTTYDGFVPVSWARRWPAEQAWRLRLDPATRPTGART